MHRVKLLIIELVEQIVEIGAQLQGIGEPVAGAEIDENEPGRGKIGPGRILAEPFGHRDAGGATLEIAAQPLKIGTLIGLKPDSNRHFLIGVVRRINKNPSAKTYVGIETLSQTPVPVELHTLPNGKQSTRTDGIYLLEVPEAQQPRTLLLARQEYEQGRILQLKAQNKAYSIRLQQVLEQSDDYSRVSFDVLARHHE